MGMFTNPLSYAGYPPGVTGTPTTQNTTVRAATAAEAAAGVLTNVYISPSTADSATALDFASPPVLGFGSTTPRPVHATTLDSTGNTSLGTGASSVVNVGVASSTIGFFGATAIVKPIGTTDLRTALINLGLYTTGGASPLNLNGGALTAGTVAAVSTVAAGTTVTATLGNITATNGNFVSSTAGKGLTFNANTATGAAASPIVINSRAGQAVFTSVSIAAAADLTLTITNSEVTASTTQVIYSMSGATTGSALSIKSVTNSAGSSAIVVTNGTGATTTTADITLNFIVVN